jgi:rare lipoprotein A
MMAAIACAAQLPPAQQGLASVYSDEFHGKRTASGERLRSRRADRCASDAAPGGELEVTNLDNGKSVRVRVNDRGPHVKARISIFPREPPAALICAPVWRGLSSRYSANPR